MIRVFLDASVLYAATVSPSGVARELVVLAAREQVAFVVSRVVLEEVGRNRGQKSAADPRVFEALRAALEWEIVAELSREAILAAARYTAVKDAPIVAAAIAARVDYLASVDHKHLLAVPEVAARSRLRIVTPHVVAQAVWESGTGNQGGV